MKITDKFHSKFIYNRRMSQLHNHISEIIKKHNIKQILDVGAGDGKIDSMIMEDTDVSITGIDVLVRDTTYIPVEEYDGSHIQKEDNSVDTLMLIDVLHHTENPEAVFKEVCRVSNKYIIIKDHVLDGFISYLKLRLMDYAGNSRFHVNLPYNYLKQKRWTQMFNANHLRIVEYKTDLNLYKGLCHLLFDSDLHFVMLLEKKE